MFTGDHGPGVYADRDEPHTRDYRQRAFTVDIGGPVGSGKTALLLALCRRLRDRYSLGAVTNDIFTRAPVGERRGAVLLVRQPLLVVFVLGTTVSVLASGQFTLRLIVDGAVSFAFVPVCEAAGIAAVWSRRRAVLSYPVTLDSLFENNVPWLVWLLALVGIGAFVPAVEVGYWITPVLVSLVVPVAWSAYLDFRLLRTMMGRTAGGAAFDVALQRAIAWPLAFTYFLGATLLSDVVPMAAGWLGL